MDTSEQSNETTSVFVKSREFVDQLNNFQLFKRDYLTE
jgi:hypothetical protein